METVATGKIAQLFKEGKERELQLPTKVKKKRYRLALDPNNIAKIEKLDRSKSTIIDFALEQYLFGSAKEKEEPIHLEPQQILKLKKNNEYLHGQLQAASEREKKLVEIIDKLATTEFSFIVEGDARDAKGQFIHGHAPLNPQDKKTGRFASEKSVIHGIFRRITNRRGNITKTKTKSPVKQKIRRKAITNEEKIYNYMKKHPDAAASDVRKAVGCKLTTAKKYYYQWKKELISL